MQQVLRSVFNDQVVKTFPVQRIHHIALIMLSHLYQEYC